MARLDLAIIILYFLTVIGLGGWYRRRAARNLEAYFLGGKSLPWPALAMSGAVGNFDITGTMWMVSVLFLLGMRSWWHHWMWGVMLPAFGLAYMAVWVRRSDVMTGAEWMVTRFGDGPDGRLARTAYALMAVVTQASFIGYAFQGIGKFAVVYLPLDSLAARIPALRDAILAHQTSLLAVLIIGAATLYVLLGGLYGVVFTDVLQTVILSFAALVIAWIAFTTLTPESVAAAVPADFASLRPVWRLEEFAGTSNAGYEMFGLLMIAWVMKGFLLNAGGPGQMYDFQRYLAARDDRDAAKLAAAWPVFLIPRWAMVGGITLLALAGIGEVTDTEQVMPLVLQRFLPAGVRGLVIAGLLAAFMSTFAGTVNSGASYIVRDLWQPFFAPEATECRLVRAGYLATVGLVAGGIVIGFQAESINEIWSWMMMALGAGVIVPNVLRWHWWRFNGWGYAAGTLGGIMLSLIALFVPTIPIYLSFPAICLGSLAGSIAVSLITAPTDRQLLVSFYRSIRPFGLWGPVRTESDTDPGEDTTVPGMIGSGALRRLGNTGVAMTGITALYLAPIYLVGHWNGRFTVCGVLVLLTAAILRLTWYPYLPARSAGGG